MKHQWTSASSKTSFPSPLQSLRTCSAYPRHRLHPENHMTESRWFFFLSTRQPSTLLYVIFIPCKERPGRTRYTVQASLPSFHENTKWKRCINLSQGISRTASSKTLWGFMPSPSHTDMTILGQMLLDYDLTSYSPLSNLRICDTQRRSIYRNSSCITLHVGRLPALLRRQTGRGFRGLLKPESSTPDVGVTATRA